MAPSTDTRKNPDIASPEPDAATPWAHTPLAQRQRWVRGFRLLLFDAMDELSHLMEEEVGKPPHEAITGDLMPLLASCRWHERHASKILKPRKPIGAPVWMFGQRHRILSVPLGHVGIIATWNYPIQLLGIQLVQALTAGNRVTIKPSERSPKTQARLVELATIGLPRGTLKCYPADREAGVRMLETENFDHVVFTGSTQVGRQIASTLAKSLTPSTLELSGRDSVLVLEDADPELAAERIWNLVAMNCGQTCMAPRRVLAAEGVYEALCEAIRRLAPTSPRPMIDEPAAAEVRRLAAEAAAAGFELVPAHGEQFGRTVMPSIVLGVSPHAKLVDGDHFGPLCAVVRCRDTDEMVEIHRSCAQHLATSVFSGQRGSVEQLVSRLGAGTVIHNDVVLPTAHPGVSIHGHRESGWGFSRGEDGLRAMVRHVHIASVSRRLRAPAGEPGEKQLGQIRGLMKLMYGRGSRP